MSRFSIRSVILSFILFCITDAFAWCSSADNSLANFLTGPVNNWEGVTYTPGLETAYGFMSALYIQYVGYANRSCHITHEGENTLSYLEIDGYQTSGNQQRNYVKAHGDVVCSGTCPDNDFKNCNGLEKTQTKWWTITCKSYPW